MNALTVTKIADVVVSLDPGAVDYRNNLIESIKGITSINDDWTLEDAVQQLRQLKSLSTSVEGTRTKVKAPVLDLGRQIDAKAKDYCAPIETEFQRVNKLVTAYQAEQRRKLEEAERIRQAELNRIAEEQRKAEAEAQRLKFEAQQAEERRQKAALEAEVAFEKSNEAAAAEQARIAEQQKAQSEALAKAEQIRLQQLEEQRKSASVPVAVAAKVSGLITKEVWKFEVVNIWELADNRDLVRIEPDTAAINAAIRSGMRACPGLRIYSETKTEVRS